MVITFKPNRFKVVVYFSLQSSCRSFYAVFFRHFNAARSVWHRTRLYRTLSNKKLSGFFIFSKSSILILAIRNPRKKDRHRQVCSRYVDPEFFENRGFCLVMPFSSKGLRTFNSSGFHSGTDIFQVVYIASVQYITNSPAFCFLLNGPIFTFLTENSNGFRDLFYLILNFIRFQNDKFYTQLICYTFSIGQFIAWRAENQLLYAITWSCKATFVAASKKLLSTRLKRLRHIFQPDKCLIRLVYLGFWIGISINFIFKTHNKSSLSRLINIYINIRKC